MSTDNRPKLWTGPRKAALAALLAAQFAAAWWIGTRELLVSTGPALFQPIALTAIVPVALFLATYRLVPAFRGFVLAQSLRTVTLLHMWRVVGFAFLALYAANHLPAVFALPAGFGDVAVGLLAIYAVRRLDRDPEYATSPGFVRFHLLGLLDFAVAISTAALAGGVFPALVPGGVTAAPMEIWPLNLFPSFIVPAFIVLQLAALLKIRERRRYGVAAGYVVQPATA